MAQRIMLKKREKTISVINMMQNKLDIQEFIRLFIENYPDDWKRINNRWKKHERKNNGRSTQCHIQNNMLRTYIILISKY